MKIFISHSSRDVEIYNELASALKEKGYMIFNANEVDAGESIIEKIKFSQYEKNKGLFSDNKTEIENSDIVIQARKKMYELRCLILGKYQGEIFDGISKLLEREWRKQQYEATKM